MLRPISWEMVAVFANSCANSGSFATASCTLPYTSQLAGSFFSLVIAPLSAAPPLIAALSQDAGPFGGIGYPCCVGGKQMKLRRPREAMPLMVSIALALMAIAAVAYLTGILIMEDILAFFSARK